MSALGKGHDGKGHWFTKNGEFYTSACGKWVLMNKPEPPSDGDSLCLECVQKVGLHAPGKSRINATKCYDERYGDPRPFPTMTERDCYYEFKLREAAGEIFDVCRQVQFLIKWNGVLIYSYTCDITYQQMHDHLPRLHVVDAKGDVVNDRFPLVRKLMKACYELDVETWPTPSKPVKQEKLQ